MDDIQLNIVQLEDVEALQRIAKKTFYETFAESNSETNMASYLDTGFSIAKLQQELKNNQTIFYFAVFRNIVIGYLKVNLGAAQTEVQDHDGLEIERIYVTREFHGKEVGKLLYEKAYEIAKQKDVSYMWLGVWEENLRAINFYKKCGFVEFDKHIFKLGDDEQTDIMMKLKLDEAATLSKSV